MLRRKSLGYPTDAAYLRAVVRQDLLELPCHQRALAVQQGPAWRRDAVDAALLAHLQNQLARAGGGGGGVKLGCATHAGVQVGFFSYRRGAVTQGQRGRLDCGLPRQYRLLRLSAHMVRVQAAQPVER